MEGGELGAAPRWSNGGGVGGEAELCCRVLGLQLEKQEAKVLGDLEVVPGDKRRVWVRGFFFVRLCRGSICTGFVLCFDQIQNNCSMGV